MTGKGSVLYNASFFTDYDIHLFREGTHFKLYDKLGAHLHTIGGIQGTSFAVWAPNAKKVSVIGNFNGWDKKAHPLNVRWDSSGIWEGFIPGVEKGEVYKYHIISNYHNYKTDRVDPFALLWENPPKTASLVWNLDYSWKDKKWMQGRHRVNALDAPISIYELHIGSWRRIPEEGNRFLSYRELAPCLADYVKQMGFTHVELMPVMEHPFYGSWGYQITGYFAPSSRYGTPQDFMYLIDYLHRHEIGVILDWVPSHFPNDEHGLTYFDGTCLYEHADPKQGFHPEWTSYIFNYGRNEVQNFLISNAIFWLDKYHIDGLRVDGVASMLYLDYAMQEGEWIPNEYGGKENLKAVNFIKRLNETIYEQHPDVQTIAEESTAWPMVSRSTHSGGLGFGMKWNMGWMHDTLQYFSKDPVHRKHHHEQLTFGLVYAFTENFALVLSHDEVVHGKGSLIGKMAGDDWQKKAGLKLLYGYMYGHPGKKLIFMGGEFGQWKEWDHDNSLEWNHLQYPFHQEIQKWVCDLNCFYHTEPALYELDFSGAGFEWIDFHDWEESIVSFLRKGKEASELILVVCNFTPVPRHNYRIGVPKGGLWQEMLNSDAQEYGGSGQGNSGSVEATHIPVHGRPHSLCLSLPPLGVLFFKHMGYVSSLQQCHLLNFTDHMLTCSTT